MIRSNKKYVTFTIFDRTDDRSFFHIRYAIDDSDQRFPQSHGRTDSSHFRPFWQNAPGWREQRAAECFSMDIV